ncbi:RNA polymerase sigma factor, sigma-70 family [Sphingopyxis sp. YR583]|uniref:RNA polymerase sigma factor n=1 Tax=Sphingopyxis sp. YR583 TaxID=1881047 RepID=UPI0008A7C1E1|nr:RNA polymerase sigma factor [Sphingopyxis sp. YR583]SEH13037.1 RNA polymerase sigma factor, sigma-70 family [Sphingopyxis sp. YR583]
MLSGGPDPAGSEELPGSEPAAHCAATAAGRLDARATWLASDFVPHCHWLRLWLARRFPNEPDLDDVVQESFTRVLGRTDPSVVRSARAYLARTAQLIIFDRKRRAAIATIDYQGSLEPLGFVCPHPLPDEIVSARQQLARVVHTLAALPERTRRIVELRRIEEGSLVSAAKDVGISETAARKHLNRAMAALRAEQEEDI